MLAVIFLLLMTTVATVTGTDDGLDTARRSPGMTGLYSMIRSFLDDVQSYSLGDLMRDYNVETFKDFDEVASEWREWAPELIGFAVCAALGLVFAVVFTIVGCCYCCCRTCCGGCCCRKVPKSKPSQCWTLTCTGLAVGTSIIMFSMTICAYQSTSLVKDELGGLMLQDVADSFRETESFAHSAADDIDVIVLGNLRDLNVSEFSFFPLFPASLLQRNIA